MGTKLAGHVRRGAAVAAARRGLCSLAISLAISLGIAAGVPAFAKGEADRPDFTGVWTWYREDGAGPLTVPWPEEPPLKPHAAAKIAEYHALVDPRGETPGAFCLGSGMPESMLGSGAYPMEIIQRPDQVTVIYEAHTEIRRIYIDGPNAALPASELFPTRLGYSTGRWDGDTLVVTTTHLKEQVDQTAAHSDEARIEERYRLVEQDDGRIVLEATLTLTDPGFYTAPVTVTKRWQQAEDARMLYYNCNEPAWEDHLEALKTTAESPGQARQ